MTTPREQRKHEKRNRILKAAMRVFSTRSYSGASMDAIAIEAAVSKPTLYQYFGDKQGLFAAVLAEAREHLLSPFAGSQGRDMVEVLMEFSWHYADFVLQPEILSLARLVIGEVERFPDLGQQYLAQGPDKALSGITGYLEQMKQAGRLEFDDGQLCAGDLWSLIFSAPRERALHIPNLCLSKHELSRSIFNGLRVFLKAYSTQAAADLTLLEQLRQNVQLQKLKP